MNNKKVILQKHIKDANLFAGKAFIAITVTSIILAVFHFFVLDKSQYRKIYLYTFIVDNILRCAVCVMIFRSKGTAAYIKYLVSVCFFFTAVSFSLIFNIPIWSLFAIMIAYSVSYCRPIYTLTMGFLLAMFAYTLERLLIPYGIYEGILSLGPTYLEQLYITNASTLLLLGLSVVMAVITNYLWKSIEVQISTAEDLKAQQDLIVEQNVGLQEAKKELEERDMIIANAGYGIWYITLTEGKRGKMKASPKMMEILGISNQNLSEEDTYHYWYSRIIPSDLNSVNNSVDDMLKGKFSENTYRWKSDKLGERYVRCGGKIQKKAKTYTVLAGYHSDVTDIILSEEKQARKLNDALYQAEKSSRSKTVFLNNVSHDMRTPMNAVIGFTNLALENLDDIDKVKHYLEKINVSSEHLLALINDVLDMSRIESGKVRLEEETVNIEELINDINTIISPDVINKKLHLDIDMQGIGNTLVITDKLRLKQVLLNILSNAIKFTPEEGNITVRIEQIWVSDSNKAGYCFTISDTGIGMSPAFKDHIFEAFSREDSSIVREIQGTGLGMAIVKNIVDMMGGTIDVDTEEGKGTSFIIKCQFIIAAAPTEVCKKREHNVDFTGVHILLAEDNPLNQEIAITILEEKGFDIDVACDGAEAVRMVKESEPGFYKLILMDVQMPNMNGYEATRTIRNMNESYASEIPIIAMTANAFEEDRREALKNGMNAHIGKPIDVQKLFDVLSDLI